MTREEMYQQFLAESAPAPDPSASAITQMLQGGLSQPMNREEMAAAYAPSDPREAVAAGFGRALGLGDEQRYNVLNEAHPNYVAGGWGAGLGLELGLGGMGAPALARGVATAGRSTVPVIAKGLEKGGRLAEVLAEPAAVVHGSKHIEMAMKYGGRGARAGAEYLRGNRAAARELMIDALKEKFPKAWNDAQKEQAAADAAFKLAPEAQPSAPEPPPPGTGALSAEMRAALKRDKFRHDYSTGEWADLLAPGDRNVLRSIEFPNQ